LATTVALMGLLVI